MTFGDIESNLESSLKKLLASDFFSEDSLSRADFVEKLIEFDLAGTLPGIAPEILGLLAEVSANLDQLEGENLRVVVFGGGTGMSNIIGGDSRSPGWPQAPFDGLKDVFPGTRAVVCVTDDGGSTGELLKDLPLIGLGDIRHVLLSSVQRRKLKEIYGLGDSAAVKTAGLLYSLFNHRFSQVPENPATLLRDAGVALSELPAVMREYLVKLIEALFHDERLFSSLSRPHCLGNLLIAAAICLEAGSEDDTKAFCAVPEIQYRAIIDGLCRMARILGAGSCAVMPCTTTPTALQVLYSNGVLVTGEYKSGHARRGYPVDRVFTRFVEEPKAPAEVLNDIRAADIIILAPGSLYSSIIPVLQVPDLAEAVRNNKRALKVLVANLWVQKGETDVVWDDPGRRFYVSDLIMAYHRNIPGGVKGLFSQVLSLGLRDIPGSILQSYATEEKIPIYLDRDRVRHMGFMPVEAGIFSQKALTERRIIQHDPTALAKAVRMLWAVRKYFALEAKSAEGAMLPPGFEMVCPLVASHGVLLSNQRFAAITERLASFSITPDPMESGLADNDFSPEELRGRLVEIIWRHRDILVTHLDNIDGIALVDKTVWKRCQEWDNVFSFYDPDDRLVKIRHDILARPAMLEVAFLVALGQALLGNYALEKKMEKVERASEIIGKVFLLTLRPFAENCSYFTQPELDNYLRLTRMIRAKDNELFYSRIVNGGEGFTPPGLLFGLTYAWYLDNRFAAHIEYKMAVMRTELSNLIPEQVKIFSRRRALVDFFRKVVFKHDSPVYEKNLVRP